jgi:hypothetical protein
MCSVVYVGLYKVLERTDKCFRLAVGGREETVSMDHLKLHLGAGPFTAALPVERDCPPGLRSCGVPVAASFGSCHFVGYCGRGY